MRFCKNFPKSSQLSSGLQALFDQQAIALMANESEFVKKDSPLTGNIFAQMCIGGTTKKGQLSTLSELCCLALQLGASLCEQSLNERFNEKAVAFMNMLFHKVIEQRFDDSTLEVLREFSQVIIEDSTIWQLSEHLERIHRKSKTAANSINTSKSNKRSC
jgi:hypothetical protein